MTVPNIVDRILAIRLFMLDVDGVMTDGGIILSEQHEEKRFHAHDGAAISAVLRAGFPVAIVTGRQSAVVERRARELGITELHQGVSDKAAKLTEIATRLGMTPTNVMFMGDDLNDLPAMAIAGLAVAPHGATRDAIDAAHLVTRRPGGSGAVREALESVLRHQGQWQRVVERYLGKDFVLAQ
jgi:3-deoxy-D-manno-octulosonate 8-phosphate phosphatase (KDO 8-P phosphatase)